MFLSSVFAKLPLAKQRQVYLLCLYIYGMISAIQLILFAYAGGDISSLRGMEMGLLIAGLGSMVALWVASEIRLLHRTGPRDLELWLFFFLFDVLSFIMCVVLGWILFNPMRDPRTPLSKRTVGSFFIVFLEKLIFTFVLIRRTRHEGVWMDSHLHNNRYTD
jgi:ABC-type iron transport system FetAB permease component